MRFVCGSTSNKRSMEVLNAERFPGFLVSFAYADTIRMIDYAPEYLMLDSGAFTAWTLGRSVSLDRYAEWAASVTRTRPDAVVISLDTIPGRPGIPPTAPERDRGIAESLENGDELRRRGFAISEVFHQYEPASHLRKLLARQRPGEVLGLSPNKSAPRPTRRTFLQETFRAMREETRGGDFPRCHGLGVIARELMFDFPFYSIDSSGWVVHRYGCAVSPEGRSYAMGVRYATSRHEGAKRQAQRETLRNLLTVSDEVTRYWARKGYAFTDLPGVGPRPPGELSPWHEATSSTPTPTSHVRPPP